MATCKKCGKKYNFWTTKGTGKGLCDKCYPEYHKAKVEEEARERAEAEVKKKKEEDEIKARLMSIIENQIHGEKLQIFGIVYWDTPGTGISYIFDYLLGAALFGGIGAKSTGKTHCVGVIAVTESKLYVIKTGTVVGEQVKVGDILGNNKVSVKSYCLKDLGVQNKQSTDPYKLILTATSHNNIILKATFPSSYERGNAQKADEITAVILAARQSTNK